MGYDSRSNEHQFSNPSLEAKAREAESRLIEIDTKLHTFFLEYVSDRAVVYVGLPIFLASVYGYFAGTEDAGWLVALSATAICASMYAHAIAKALRDQAFEARQKVKRLVEDDVRHWERSRKGDLD